MKSGLSIGQIGELAWIVDPTMTITLGQLSQATVFSTPAMILLMERATREALRPFLEDGEESVGVDVQVEHLAPAVLGATVRGVARVTAVEGRRIHFSVTAYEGDREIGRGTHRRSVVALSRLLENVAKVSDDSGQAMSLIPNRGELPDLETLLVSVANRIATITLNRPRSLNAVNRLVVATRQCACGAADRTARASRAGNQTTDPRRRRATAQDHPSCGHRGVSSLFGATRCDGGHGRVRGETDTAVSGQVSKWGPGQRLLAQHSILFRKNRRNFLWQGLECARPPRFQQCAAVRPGSPL